MKKKKSLGRGLSALFENEVSLSLKDKSKQDYQNLAVDFIHANPDQPRTHFDQKKLEELAASIKHLGIIEPIIVKPRTNFTKSTKGNHYEVIAGERRLRAAKIAGLTEIPVIIKSSDNDNLMEMMLIENLQREDLTPLEEAQSYETIINKKNFTQEKLSKILGKSRSHITNMIRILKAPQSVKQMLVENRLSLSQVRTLITLPEKEMIRLAQEAENKNLSVRALENLVNSYHRKKIVTTKGIKTSTTSTRKDPNISEIEEIYRNKLKTKVTIYPLKNNKGRIEIEYYNYDELLEILSKIKE